MNVVERNQLYLKGINQGEGLFPHLEVAPASGFFNWDFGLAELPREPGIIVIRGPRQYGKSTIDEITAVGGWQKAIKRLADRGVLRKVLIITTGSKASDIQREAELLPGRKGKLARTTYLFVQLPYKIFYDKAFPTLKAQTLAAYLIAGGSPPACAAVLETGSVPEYVFQTTADWIYGECALAGRSRPMLLRLLEQLMRRGASPIAQTTLAEESGMANNTVAHGYLNLLSDLLVLGASEPWDPSRKMRISREASKYPFVNLLAANTWSANRHTTPTSLERATGEEKAAWWEWAVASELFRRAAKQGHSSPLRSQFWRSEKHEIDFVRQGRPWIEVKAGHTSPFEFDWFIRTFSHEKLLVVSADRFDGGAIRGVTLEDFLLDESL